MKARR